MASKSPDDDAPPAYSPLPIPDLTSALSTHLSTLPARMRAAHSAHASAQSALDTELALTVLLPRITAFLASLAHLAPPGPAAAQLTLVPAGAVAADWAPSETPHSRASVLQRLERVEVPPAKLDYDAKVPHPTAASTTDADPLALGAPLPGPSLLPGSNQRMFDAWGRWGADARFAAPAFESGFAFGDAAAQQQQQQQQQQAELWWSDGDAAARLARCLSLPVQKGPAEDLLPQSHQQGRLQGRQQDPPSSPPQQRKRGGFGGLLRALTASDPVPPPSPPQEQQKSQAPEVAMHVRPEEVTFRRENQFGVWESKSGWALVVAVRLRR